MLLPAVTHTLRTEPSPDQLTDFLLTLLRAPLGVEQVALVAEGTHEGNARSIWGCRPALAEAPLDGIPLPGSRDILAATDRPLVPQDGAAGTLIATALIDDADLRVWLVVATPSGEDIEHVRETLQELHGVLALYVTQIRHAREARTAVVVPHGITALTPRQHRILRLMAEGLTNQQIALRIGYSTSTVRMENLHIFRALDVHDRAAAVRVARAESAT